LLLNLPQHQPQIFSKTPLRFEKSGVMYSLEVMFGVRNGVFRLARLFLCASVCGVICAIE